MELEIMGEELNEFFGGMPELYFAPIGEEKMQKLGEIITANNSLSTEDAIELDRLNVREAMQIEPISCSFDLADGQDLEAIFGIRTEAERPKICSLTISSMSYIRRPKNLKYPNKKRARRIWKKWAKRYGGNPAQSICFPNAEMSCEMDNDGLSYKITVKPLDNGK